MTLALIKNPSLEESNLLATSIPSLHSGHSYSSLLESKCYSDECSRNVENLAQRRAKTYFTKDSNPGFTRETLDPISTNRRKRLLLISRRLINDGHCSTRVSISRQMPRWVACTRDYDCCNFPSFSLSLSLSLSVSRAVINMWPSRAIRACEAPTSSPGINFLINERATGIAAQTLKTKQDIRANVRRRN